MNFLNGATGVLSRPPVLTGHIYNPEDVFWARDNEKLLSIFIETNTSCNLSCLYCPSKDCNEEHREVEFEKVQRIIVEAKELGAKSIVLIGQGEPMLYSRFSDLIVFIDKRGLTPVVFTNAITMNADIAGFLYDHSASVMAKLDSFRPSVQDHLSGVDGSYVLIHAGLHNLIEAGFTDTIDAGRLRMGISFVGNRLNREEIEEIWHFCRHNNVFPNMDAPAHTCTVMGNRAEISLTQQEIHDYKKHLFETDRCIYNYEWTPYSPYSPDGCLLHLCSLYVTIDGNVRPCASIKFDEHPFFRTKGSYEFNAFHNGLLYVYKSELFKRVRFMGKKLEGKCGDCNYLNGCTWCRGFAYNIGIKRGLDPYGALELDCKQCLR